ncbi:MAG: M20/M25/M40 family metallo-hydrolase [Hyphomonadaceae bacterium]|nr:M20/M25/M40 family metallo-hydrolase [Hyphomonadaceae bacterium]MBX3510296.1 M20/M25/M40 family metallo-hydrolase [Hyphomonadaceae bacterium]
MRNFLFGLMALAFASSANAQPQPAAAVAPIPAEVQRTLDRLSASAFETNRAYDIVESLVTEIGPRMAGSEAEARARDWAVAMLREQRFSNIRIEPFTLGFWQATREEAAVVTPSPQRMVIAALGGSPATPEGGLEAEIVRFPDLAALEAATPGSLNGRIVFIDERMQRTQDGSGYGAAVAKRGRCAPLAQARGAVACLIRSVGTDPHRFAHQGGNTRQADGAALPAAALSPADADLLARLVARGPTRVRLDIQVDARENAQSGNVIAEIRGRERPEEIVLLVAHLDSWDHGQGAIDDGAGVAIVTAAARLIRDLPRRPRRTIRVLLAGAEETGIHGANAYARAHAAETHIVAAESDFGAARIYRLRTRFAEPALPYARAMQRALAPLGVIPGDNAANGGPDLTPLRAAGVPVVELSQDGWDYFDYHHTPDDTLDKIEPAALQQNVAAYAVFAYLAAEMDWDFRAPSQ